MDKKKVTPEYANVRIKKSSHTGLKHVVERLNTSWVRLFDALSKLSDEEIDSVLKPVVVKYNEENQVSDYMLFKKLKQRNPEELKRFIDSL